MFSLLFVSFIAGILTVLAPCVLPLLPVILGGSLVDTRDRLRPYIIILSLIVSLLLFTLLLRASTVLIGVPPSVWSSISGGILVLFGLTWIWPAGWAWLMERTGFEHQAQHRLQSASGGWILEPLLIGSALGPVFTSCSPTYTLLLAMILPVGWMQGLAGLGAYFLGLWLVMLLIVWFGRSVIVRVKWLADPQGLFRRTLGWLMLIVGVMIVFGLHKTLETSILDQGFFLDTTQLERTIHSWFGLSS